ncbi:MAG: hypothetical protein WCG25_00655 [bacterium]
MLKNKLYAPATHIFHINVHKKPINNNKNGNIGFALTMSPVC